VVDDNNVAWGAWGHAGPVWGGKDRRQPTPAELAARAEGLSAQARTSIPLSSTSEVPGRAISGHVSFVSAISTMDASTSQRKGSESELLYGILTQCKQRLVQEALALGADAVVGVTVSWVSGNVGGATIGTAAGRGDKVSVCLTGTAVTLEP
jgi:uncharacterized protein YbjQ (UPF0145 family)